MSELDKLYQTLQNLKDLNFEVDEKLLKQVNEREEQLIKKEVLPALSDSIEPLLSKIQRDLVLIVEHHPNQPLSVALSRNVNATQLIEAKKIEMDPEVPHIVHPGKDKSNKIIRGSRTGLCITFPNGTVINEKKAADTLEAFVRKVGVSRVRQVVEQQKIHVNRVPLISNRRDSKYGSEQHDLGGGWLLITHSSTASKKKVIEKISSALGLGVKVEII